LRIGFVVEGDAEYAAFPLLLPKIQTRHTLLKRALKAQVDPVAGLGKLVRGLMPSVRTLVLQRKANLVVVVLDREQQTGCPGNLGAKLRTALVAECGRENLTVKIEVVLKDRMFENWLVADVDALRSMPQRFSVPQTFANQVAPDRADRADATRLLKDAVKKGSYDKVEDAKRVIGAAEPLRIAANSRSFRRFLRVAGSPSYAGQSRVP